MQKKIKFASDKLHLKNLIFIDGITRSGKFWLANFLNHLDRTEHTKHDQFMDHISIANYLGCMEDEAAVSILRAKVLLYTYEISIGRNLNFRYSDSSSVFKNPKLQDYLLRTFSPDRKQEEVFNEVADSERIFVFLAHDWLSYLKIQLEAFDQMRIVRIERNPIDLVYAWFSTGIGLNRMAFSYRIESSRGSAPWFAYQWLESFEEMTDMDRIIRSILFLSKSAQENYKGLADENKNKIIFTSYERLANNPLSEAERIAKFLKTTVNPTIPTLINQNIFNERDYKSLLKTRQNKIKIIEKHATPQMAKALWAAEEEYNQDGYLLR